MELLVKLDELDSTVDICALKDQLPWLPDYEDVRKITMELLDVETILPVRVPEENFVDLLYFVRASFRVKGHDWKIGLVSAKLSRLQLIKTIFFKRDKQ